MQKAKYANKGAILVLVLLLTSAVISAATVLLSTSDINYKMKHISRRVKKAQYNAEGALLEAYAIALEYIESALGYADDKENFKNAYINFILGNCEDLPENVGLINILKDNKISTADFLTSSEKTKKRIILYISFITITTYSLRQRSFIRLIFFSWRLQQVVQMKKLKGKLR